jgi:hypothetical protein
MLRDVILWLAGVPIVVIILLHLFGVSIETLKRSGSDRPQQPPCRKGKVNRRVGWAAPAWPSKIGAVEACGVNQSCAAAF